MRVDGIIDYYKVRLDVKGYKQRKMWVFLIHNKPKGFMVPIQDLKCVDLLNLCIDWSKFQCNDMRNLTMKWCQMSLDLMWLVCDVKFITRGYVIVEYARVSVVDVIQEMKISNMSNGLVSITWEMWRQFSENTLCKENIIFGKSYKSKQTCIVAYLCLLFVYVGSTKLILISTCSLVTKYHELVALKWKYFQIIKWIRN